jgi:hypothetical protein
MWITPEISSFLVGGPSSLAWRDGAIFGMGCMVPQPLEGTNCVQNFGPLPMTHGTRGTRSRQ